jgi:hypothetical protein
MTNSATDRTLAGFEDDIDDDFIDYGVEFSVWRKLRHDEENDYVSRISGRIYETHENGDNIDAGAMSAYLFETR